MENDKTFELLSKLYSDMQEGFNKINKKFENIDKKFENIDKKFENIDKKFENIDKRFDEVNKRVDDNGCKIDTVSKEISDLKKDVNDRFDKFSKDIGNLVTNDIAEGISVSIQNLKTDIKFLTHKTQETEKDIYIIESHLKIVK